MNLLSDSGPGTRRPESPREATVGAGRGRFCSWWDIWLRSRPVRFVFPASGIFHYSSDIQISHRFLLRSRFREKYTPDSSFI